jgi:hypothetical protein
MVPESRACSSAVVRVRGPPRGLAAFSFSSSEDTHTDCPICQRGTADRARAGSSRADHVCGPEPAQIAGSGARANEDRLVRSVCVPEPAFGATRRGLSRRAFWDTVRCRSRQADRRIRRADSSEHPPAGSARHSGHQAGNRRAPVSLGRAPATIAKRRQRFGRRPPMAAKLEGWCRHPRAAAAHSGTITTDVLPTTTGR